MQNINEVIDSYSLNERLKDDDLSIIQESSHQKFNAYEFLVKEGDERPQLFFILKGLVRVFYIKDDGKEITHTIRWEMQFVGSNDILFYQRPSRFYIQALEPTEVLVSDYSNVVKQIENRPNLLMVKSSILEEMLKMSLQRVESFTLLSPEERYLELIEKKPDLINRISDKYLANMLGITPVSFSRIKRRIMVR